MYVVTPIRQSDRDGSWDTGPSPSGGPTAEWPNAPSRFRSTPWSRRDSPRFQLPTRATNVSRTSLEVLPGAQGKSHWTLIAGSRACSQAPSCSAVSDYLLRAFLPLVARPCLHSTWTSRPRILYALHKPDSTAQGISVSLPNTGYGRGWSSRWPWCSWWWFPDFIFYWTSANFQRQTLRQWRFSRISSPTPMWPPREWALWFSQCTFQLPCLELQSPNHKGKKFGKLRIPREAQRRSSTTPWPSPLSRSFSTSASSFLYASSCTLRHFPSEHTRGKQV